MLSQTAEYALRAVLHLATEGGDRPLRVDEVAKALGVPRNYLSKILHVLAREGVLASSRGPQGGFRLGVPAARLPLERVVAPFDRLLERNRCLLGRPTCSDLAPCAAHDRWKGVAGRLLDFFRQTTVAELSRPSTAGFPVPATRRERGAGGTSAALPPTARRRAPAAARRVPLKGERP